jgi:nucleotide-binding universal stress UspA family protein
MYRNILLAYDGSMEGVLALREGALLAKTCGAKVVLLSVVPNGAGAAEMAEGLGGALAEQVDEYKSLLKQAVIWL